MYQCTVKRQGAFYEILFMYLNSSLDNITRQCMHLAYESSKLLSGNLYSRNCTQNSTYFVI